MNKKTFTLFSLQGSIITFIGIWGYEQKIIMYHHIKRVYRNGPDCD